MQSPPLIPYDLRHARVPHNVMPLSLSLSLASNHPIVFNLHYWNPFLPTLTTYTTYLNRLYTQHTHLYILINYYPLSFNRQLLLSHSMGFLHSSRPSQEQAMTWAPSVKMGAQDRRSRTFDCGAPTPAWFGSSLHYFNNDLRIITYVTHCYN